MNAMFHAHSGWYFQRRGDGVRVTRKAETAEADTVDFDAETWASIVAAVSAQGENAQTFATALEFQLGARVEGGSQ